MKIQMLVFSAFFSHAQVFAQQPVNDHVDAGSAMQKVTGEKLKQILPNATLHGDDGKYIFTHRLLPDGTVQGGSAYSGGGGGIRATDSGKWRVNGDNLCIHFEKWGNGTERCRGVESFSDGRYRYTGRRYTFSIQQ